jgi:hypothetical protein
MFKHVKKSQAEIMKVIPKNWDDKKEGYAGGK